jgi:F-type H+-transporting ATPase subunit delta
MAGALANRYARALADVTTKAGAAVSPEKVTGELGDFLAALDASADLRHALASPAIPNKSKKALVRHLGERLGLSAITRNFLLVVVDHRRTGMLHEMLAAFQAQLDERLGVARAEVAASQPVEDDQRAAIAERLGRLIGKQVRLNITIDPSLLGGAVARVGSTIFDGSLSGQLRALERKLATE